MKHFYKFLFVVFLFPAFSYAQGNYKPGYVVTLKGDTIKGFVDYRDWDRNPKVIAFKTGLALAGKQQYSAMDIAAFAVDNYENYKRFAGWISQDKLGISTTNFGIDTSKKMDTVFLRVINSGNLLTLYVYKDEKKIRFFISDNKAAPVELSYHEYYKQSNNGAVNIITLRDYKLQLKRLAVKYRPGDTKLIPEIENAGFYQATLNKIVSELDSSSNHMRGNKSNRDGARFFIGIAANSSVISYSSDNAALKNSTGSSVFPKIDVGTDIFINKNVRTVAFRLELYFTKNKVNVTGHSRTYDLNLDYYETMKFNQSIASFNPQVVYNFYNTEKIKVYAALGAALNINKISNPEYAGYIDYGTGSKGYIPLDFPGIPTIDYSLTTKIGCEINKKISAFAGYNPPTALNDNFGHIVYLKSYCAGINYFFGK